MIKATAGVRPEPRRRSAPRLTLAEREEVSRGRRRSLMNAMAASGHQMVTCTSCRAACPQAGARDGDLRDEHPADAPDCRSGDRRPKGGRFVAEVLGENHRMVQVFRDAGFL
jgi:hypothetical protein